MLSHGTEDSIVPLPSVAQYFDKVALQDKAFNKYSGALHRPFDDIGREQVVDDIAQWLNSHL
jgi:alpha-beta hydrolase superfamily lysophospholipase